MASHHQKVAIIGSGAWGLSTALHLVECGYTDITVFDRAESIPSQYSAGCDLNKIVRAEYEDSFYCDLALRAMKEWKRPLYAPHYHETGYINAVAGRAPEKVKTHLDKALASVQANPSFAPAIRRLNGPDDFREYAWQFSGPLTGFQGYHNRLGGYVHSSNAMKAVWQHCASQGVKFLLGPLCGSVESIAYSDHGVCVGIHTADGRRHVADLVICAAGAYSAKLIPSFGRFTTARCWSVAHVQLSDDEADLLRDIPTTNIRNLGFFFEPDPKTKLFKLCPLGPGYIDTKNEVGVSVPPTSTLGGSVSGDWIPAADEQKLRQLLQETFPWMANRPFIDKKMCWFSDSRDSNYCIDYVPGTSRSLVCLGGDSGHGFKMIPIVGAWVVDLLKSERQNEARWTWRTTDLKSHDWSSEVSWRTGTGGELSDVLELETRPFSTHL